VGAPPWSCLLRAAACPPRKRDHDARCCCGAAAGLEEPEVARKLYPAIRRVFEHARIRLRDEHGIALPDNPARWDDLKAMGFEAPAQLSRGRHPSLPYQQLSAFMAALRGREAVAAHLLEFLILTNVRTGAALNATWDQFDIASGVWSVPVVNLKDKKHRKEPFRIPLSARALDILREMQRRRFPLTCFPALAGIRFQTWRC
jgi:integrase